MLLAPCNHHSSLAAKTLLNPTPQIPFPLFFFRMPLYKSIPRRSVAAAAADTQAISQSAIQRIADKLRSLGYVDDNDKEDSHRTLISNGNSTSPGEIFVPLPTQLPNYRVGHTLDPSWSTPENPVPEPGSGSAIQRFHKLKRGILKEEEEQRSKRRVEKKEKVPTLAELTLPEEELRRLRTIGIGLKKKLKIGKAGITEGIVNGIHERWRSSELVKIECEDLCRMNMKRSHDLLERKTGGLVIWRSGSKIILYRGADYKYPYFFSGDNSSNDTSNGESLDLRMDCGVNGGKGSSLSGVDAMKSDGPNSSKRATSPPLIQGVGSPNRVRFQLPGEAQLAEEADYLLDGLGPRFTDWWGCDPLPVDADLLPAVVPGYRRPFRLLPYGVKPKLTDDEMTILKRLGRPLPCHFALGRNRKLQGLAASVVKLWEKCEIAKIAVKRGVQNTNSELMAEELKWLTGGTLLSRDKEFIVLYRGKDFLPASVSSAIEERRKFVVERQKSRTTYSLPVINAPDDKLETMERASLDEQDDVNGQTQKVVTEQRKLKATETAIKRISTKLSTTLEKKATAEKLLAELQKNDVWQQAEVDKEGITKEEKYMLRKVGLRMKPFLLLGRRGVFDGTIENMHLHWKYRELVKIISGEKSIEEVHGIARALEAESGGILVAVERVSKGYAIIMYRGKNYKRPACLRPQTLLNKREALKRSIEAQRCESLKLHVLKLSRNVDELKLKLAKDKAADNMLLSKQLKTPLVKEQERNKVASTKFERSDDFAVEHISYAVDLSSAPEKENVEDGDGGVADRVPFNSNAAVDASKDSLKITQQDMSADLFSKYEDKFHRTDLEPISELVLKETIAVTNVNGEGGDVESTAQPDDLRINNAEPRVSDIKKPCIDAPKSELEQVFQRAAENGRDSRTLRAARLSNRERLLLRKQALKMRKRPVLAIGKSNIVTGVAKAIKAHFQKNPLAIVNVKGRAKGTSVQEVVFKLEQATGAVLVSQEPSKVILYRGWGAGEEPVQINRKHTRDSKSSLAAGEGGTQPVISSELMSAIRLECGLKCNQVEEGSP